MLKEEEREDRIRLFGVGVVWREAAHLGKSGFSTNTVFPASPKQV